MRLDRELTIDELSAVCGGATAKDGTLPHPQPSPFQQIIAWIVNALR